MSGSPSEYFSTNSHHEDPNPNEQQGPLHAWGHASYRKGASASPSQLLYDPAHIFHDQAPAAVVTSRGYKKALQGAKLLPDPSNVAVQTSHAGGELRCQLLESEVKRLRQQLSTSENSSRLKNEEIHHIRHEIGNLHDKYEKETYQLKSALSHKEELINVYQQLAASTSQNKDLMAQVELLLPLCKRPLSPQPASLIKRTRPNTACGTPLDQTISEDKDTPKWVSTLASQKDSFNSPGQPRYSSERPASESSHRPASNRITMRGADFYDPPYAVKKQEIDRYVPAPRSNNWSADRYSPSSPKVLRTNTEAAASPDMTIPAKLEVSRAVFEPSSTSAAPNSGGERHPFKLKGVAHDAFLRSQRLGVPYNPAKHVGIPRQCTICSKTLPSGGELDRHMRARHPGCKKKPMNSEKGHSGCDK